MKIKLILSVEDPEMIDSDDLTGLTEEAYDGLMDGVADAGFSVSDGPTQEV